MIVVSSATGAVGGHLVTELCRRGEQVRALVRTPEEGDALRGYDCAVVAVAEGDRIALADALRGADAVFACTDDPAAAALAETAGPARVVLLARLGEQPPGAGTAQALLHAPLMQDLLDSVAALQEEGALAWPASGSVALVDARDVAAAAADALLGSADVRVVVGPEDLSPQEASTRLAGVLGRPVDVRPGPADVATVEGDVRRGERRLEDFVADHRAVFR